ncbi:hypothetical protein ZIOFF_042500 [Zingiber officinale]|uniref:histidinol-phosphate transaminase n=1 Tax=Zingiber officinale TaxID=94328 RepID=A0A8J5KTI1_ZINOF|nr:hypothetical protein ZIOFF_042500 [Zingiber officinale]
MGGLRCSTAISSSSVADVTRESRRSMTRFMASALPVEQVDQPPAIPSYAFTSGSSRPISRSCHLRSCVVRFHNESDEGANVRLYSGSTVVLLDVNLQVLSTHLGRKPEDIVKLDANENPYGPPPEASLIFTLIRKPENSIAMETCNVYRLRILFIRLVSEALGTLKFPYVYPDPESRRLRAALAEDSGLESDYILAGCGADELIDLIMSSSFDAVPRQADFSLDIPQIVEAVEKEKPKCIFLTSPNNPDGSIISDEDLLKILNLPILVVLDEAYIEFSELESKMKWVKRHENLIILRTFSKRAVVVAKTGLAGLRVGYGAFPLSIIQCLWRAKQPYNVSVAAEVSACAALQNPEYLEDIPLLVCF